MPRLRGICATLVLFVGFSGPVAAQECNDGIDNNANGFYDLADFYCKSPDDDDESSFYSGVPGDDANLPAALDCWFDTNSGTGDDGCSIHACCGIDGPCPAELDAAHFDPGSCAASQQCASNCLPLAAPTTLACDCFGCCEFCSGATGCVDVFVNPVVSPSCTLKSLGDPASCRRCVRNETCGGPPQHIFINGFETVPAGSLTEALQRATR